MTCARPRAYIAFVIEPNGGNPHRCTAGFPKLTLMRTSAIADLL